MSEPADFAPIGLVAVTIALGKGGAHALIFLIQAKRTALTFLSATATRLRKAVRPFFALHGVVNGPPTAGL